MLDRYEDGTGTMIINNFAIIAKSRTVQLVLLQKQTKNNHYNSLRPLEEVLST